MNESGERRKVKSFTEIAEILSKPVTVYKEGDRSKIAKKSRRKGQGFERKVCQLLEELTGYKFRRTPLSGGWAKEKLTGDVVCIDNDNFEWSVEAKNQEGWDLSQLLRPNNKGLTKIEHWWTQCYDDALRSKKYPMLLFTKNHYPVYCMCYKEHIAEFSSLPNYYFNYINRVIFIFEDFIEINNRLWRMSE